ncbi:MAG: VCBS repeat-containing protein [Thermoguttaceae bacterium]|nr:VCBS repeat-containing protein [Thermoguttaceae bacterium]
MAAKKRAKRERRRLGGAILGGVSLTAALLGVGGFGGFNESNGAWAQTSAASQGLTRLEVNNPEAETFLGVGLWSWPVPADVDGDGRTDLVVSCEDVPYNGVWYFRNAGPDPKFPVFEKAKRLSRGVINVQASWVDGKLRVLTPGKEHPDFLKTGVEKSIPLKNGTENLPQNVHFNKVRGNMWKLVDFEGDGATDIVVGTDDWTEYGWDDAFDANGVWQNAPLRGNLYLLRNVGTDAAPRYEDAKMLTDVDGAKLETFGWPSPNFVDFDGDGDLDLLCAEFRDTLQYSENVGTRTEPRYRPFEPLTLTDGTKAAVELAMPTPVAFDWDADGDADVLVGDEDGRIAFFENSGELKDGKPLFKPPYYFRQEPDLLKCGALSTPWGVDWDDDGDWDLICGNTAGYVFFFENLSGPGVENPRWATPVALASEPDAALLAAAKSLIPETAGLVETRRDGTSPIRITAGPNGSIQGPAEPKWGYTTLSVADWDGDGLKDVVLNSILGNVYWYKNVGEKGAPKLSQPRAVEVAWDGAAPRLAWGWRFPKGNELLTQWRTTPVALDFNGDGATDLAMLDAEGYLALYERFKSTDEKSGETSLKLAPPKRVFVDGAGKPLRLNSGRAGASGRRKICFADYNGDGKLDLLANGSNADLYLQTKAENGLYYFASAGEIDARPIKGHSSSPTTVDFNGDGVPDPLVGAEDGHFYYKRNDWTPGQTATVRFESDALTIETTLKTARLENGAKAFANRDYVWGDVASELAGREYPQTFGGTPVDVVVRAKKATAIELLVGTTWPKNDGASYLVGVENKELGATLIKENAAKYNDKTNSPLALFEKKLEPGEVWVVPVSTWSGTLILFPQTTK